MNPQVTIELIDRWNLVPAGEWVSLRFKVSRPVESTDPVFVPADGVGSSTATLNRDLFLHDVVLNPGDSVSFTVGVRFDAAGALDTNCFRIQVNPVAGSGRENEIVRFPSHPFRVVPSLERALAVTLTRVCEYDDAVKVEFVARNAIESDLTDVELTLGPADVIRAGPLRRRQPLLAPGQEMRFDLVVAGPSIDLSVAATIEGEHVEGKRTLTVPLIGETSSDNSKLFTFLEPRALTTDRITLAPVGKSAELTASGGVFSVRGGKSRYKLAVFPSHPQAKGVKLYGAAGQVEVGSAQSSNGPWSFDITVIENSVFTQLVRLDYDVEVEGPSLRGELYLSIKPTKTKLWAIAITAGLALTAKGLAALGPVLFRPDEGIEGLAEHMDDLLQRRWFDLFQLVSIPFFWGVLLLTDRVWRIFQEE